MITLNLLTFTAIAILSSSFVVNALSIDSSAHIARHQVIARQLSQPVPIKKRSNRCKPRATSAVPSTQTPAPASSQVYAPASSSAPPAPSPSPVSGNSAGGKAGLAWNDGDDCFISNFKRLETVYTWSPFKPGCMPDGMTFLPMLWGWKQLDDFTRLVKKGYADVALGPNEPDMPGQASMDVGSAVSLWRQAMDPLVGQGYQLISPAVSSAPSGKTWMQGFIAACTGCTVNGIALHFYGTDAKAFIAHVEDYHNTFGMDVWVTEVACQDFGGGPQVDQNHVTAFLDTITTWMDQTSYVKKYFYFGAMKNLDNVNTFNSLVSPDGQPNQLGWDYINHNP